MVIRAVGLTSEMVRAGRRIRRIITASWCLTLVLAAAIPEAEAQLTALPGFGATATPGYRGQGVALPGDSPEAVVGGTYVYTSQALNNNNTRGLAYNPVTGNLIMPGRSSLGAGNSVRVLSGSTGVDIGGSGTAASSFFSGGTFLISLAGVSDDGAIYVSNLGTATNSVFKIYKFESEAQLISGSAPTVAFSGPNAPLLRVGDSFAVRGSGTGATFAAAGSNSTSAGINGYFWSGALDGSNTSTRYTAVPGSGTATAANNDYRLGLTFIDGDTIIGTQGGIARITDFNGTTAVVTGSLAFGAADRPLDYVVLDGIPFVAIADTNSAQVSVYNVSDPAGPSLWGQLNLTGTTFPIGWNLNGAGGVAWGAVTVNPGPLNDSATLFTMVTNEGVQGMVFTVPEPSTVVVLGCGIVAVGGFAVRRRSLRRGPR